MTLLDGGGFQMGTTGGSTDIIDKSLDEIIKSRAQNQKKQAVVDKTVGRARAKRQAAVDARRGITQSSKPTRMQIDQSIKSEQNKTAIKNAKKVTKKTPDKNLTTKERAQLNKAERETQAKGRKAAAEEKVPVVLTRKQLKAARKAIADIGGTIPGGYELKLVQKPVPKTPKQTGPKKTDPKKPGAAQPMSGRGGGR